MQFIISPLIDFFQLHCYIMYHIYFTLYPQGTDISFITTITELTISISGPDPNPTEVNGSLSMDFNGHWIRPIVFSLSVLQFIIILITTH